MRGAKQSLSIALVGLFVILLSGWRPFATDLLTELTSVPQGFPEVQHPEDNAFTLDRWNLGRKLFFDPVMSRDSSISCASCHHPGVAFSDTVAFSPGVANAPGTRNAPTLTNVAYHPYLTRDGGVPTLEMQVLVPIQEHNEFDFNIIPIADRLAKDSTYSRMSRAAYGNKPGYFVITRALACYERTLISGNSPYDRYEQHGERKALSKDAQAGMQLFFSDRLNCTTCHSGFNFTNYAFENNGLHLAYPDSGRMRVTKAEADRARFKVPTLRNVALTAPYMHDGSLETLEEVVEHYNSGGLPHKHKSPAIKPLGLTKKEKIQLVAFLRSLTDPSFAANPHFLPN